MHVFQRWFDPSGRPSATQALTSFPAHPEDQTMLHFSDSKSMAKALRNALAERRIEISHSDSLEIVAQQFGFANWNMLSARIEGDDKVPPLPDGWMISGQGRPNLYRIGVDPTLPGTIKIEAMDRKGVIESGAMGSLMQSISAENYRGRAVRISAELRGRGAERGVLWMRVDPSGPVARPLRFDNMLERKKNGAVRGDVDWVERTIVLDVPEAAHSIHYGIMLGGGGELWARNFKLESLDPDSVEVTQPKMLTEPTNLDFRGETWRA
jgi:hypothetical protein